MRCYEVSLRRQVPTSSSARQLAWSRKIFVGPLRSAHASGFWGEANHVRALLAEVI